MNAPPTAHSRAVVVSGNRKLSSGRSENRLSSGSRTNPSPSALIERPKCFGQFPNGPLSPICGVLKIGMPKCKKLLKVGMPITRAIGWYNYRPREMPQDEQFQISISAPEMVGAPFQRLLQEIYWRVAFGLNKANLDESPPNLLELPLSVLQIAPASDLSSSPEVVRNNFKSWLIANGLRDCAEAFHAYLEDVFKACNTLESAKFNLGDEQIRDKHLIRSEQRFHRADFPQKMECLSRLFGITFRQDLLRYVESLNVARNCLVHRRGIVGVRDLDTHGQLVVEWGRLALIGMSPEGNRVIAADVSQPVALDEGEGLGLQFVEERRVYRRGDSIGVSIFDFAGFIATYLTLITSAVPQIADFRDRCIQNIVQSGMV